MRDYGFSPAQQDEIWHRWRAGESFNAMGRALGVPMHHVRSFLAQTGGIRHKPQGRSAGHLSCAEREEISRGLAAGLSARVLARRLGRASSTISREIARNGGRFAYRAVIADQAAYRRARRPKPTKLARHPALRAIVQDKLALRWSPEQISGWLRRTFPLAPDLQISHEAIYLSLFDPRRRRSIDRTLTRQLRSARPMRHPKGAKQRTGRGVIRDMVSISARPAEVDDRTLPGHWEGDLLMGTRPSAIATLVERTSRFTALVALPDGIKAHEVRPYLTRQLLHIPEPLRRSLTWDRGREMAEHQALAADTGVRIYFCHKRSPWERGTNENTNGLLRQYMPKNADLRKFDQPDLDWIAAELNDRPRRILGYRSPSEVYSGLLTSGDALTL
ncbi:IS30 family transposase [Nonomuraea sp. NPDC050540]|uniref:IS30 family transposase n=1 Tax=Nonomuraea sp. NPDC050540 TaxID=3364367 RepID=UPI00379A16FB